jgi:hypothetical protein
MQGGNVMSMKTGIAACLAVGLMLPCGATLSEPFSLNFPDQFLVDASASQRSFMASVDSAAIAMPTSVALDDNAFAASQLLATQSRRLGLVAARILVADYFHRPWPEQISVRSQWKSTVHAESPRRADLKPKIAEPRKIAHPPRIARPQRNAEPPIIAGIGF